MNTLAASGNAFALDLYSRVAGGEGNLFLSPYSIHSALSMVYAGARGETAGQMQHVLHLSTDQNRTAEIYGQMIKDLNQGGEGRGKPNYKLVVADAVWGQKGVSFVPDFRNVLEDDYGAQLEVADFTKPEDARARINSWVAEKTESKIPDLIPPGALTPETRAVLANAIYFKSAWESSFEKTATINAPFHPAAAESIQVSMMRQVHSFDYAENADLQVVALPYFRERLSMVVLLPRQVDGIGALEKELTPDSLDVWTKNLLPHRVDLSLPRFKFSARLSSLASTLSAMGMTTAFDPKTADFSGMVEADRWFISQVIHQAFVDVNEEGTEAAAATAVGMATAIMQPPERPIVFRADHPFFFVIRDNGTGALLFMGRVANPKG